MIKKEVLNLSVPREVREWIVLQAQNRRLSMSEYAVMLITKGIQAESIDESVQRLQAAVQPHSDTLNLLLQQVLATRYLVEQTARGVGIKAVTLGSDANSYAAKELANMGDRK